MGTLQGVGRLAAVAALAGCAAAPGPATQTLRVETPGCEQASCELRNDRGVWLLQRAPGEVTLLRSAAALLVQCQGAQGGRQGALAQAARPQPSGVGIAAGAGAGGLAMGAALGPVALSFIPALGAVAVLGGAAAGAAVGGLAEQSLRGVRYPDLVSVPMSCPPDAPAAALLGLQVQGAAAGGGVLVAAVVPGGAAAAAGLRTGDRVLDVDGRAPADAAALEEQVQATPPGVPMAWRVLREGAMLTLTLARPKAAP